MQHVYQTVIGNHYVTMQMVSGLERRHAELLARKITRLSLALYLKINSTANFAIARTHTTKLNE